MSDLPQRTVAVVLFEGFTVLDAYGPIQAFGACAERLPDGTFHRHYKVVTVAEQAGPVRSGEGPATLADFSFADLPQCDLLLIPGGMGTRTHVGNQAFLDQVRQVADRTPLVTTVCTGAALLARTGLLDGVKATSNKMAWDWVKQQGPNVDWVRQARWVDVGAIATSSGVSAGTDMALALIARLNGREVAERTARIMEYVWNDTPENDPFA